MAQDQLSQLRTSRGFVRVRGVRPVRAGVPCLLEDAVGLLFDPVPPTELASGSLKPLLITNGPGDGLVSLGSLAKHNEDGTLVVRRDVILDHAPEFGPLFGRSLIEPLGLWSAAVNIAELAITLQRVANGSGELSLLKALGSFQIRHLTSAADGSALDIYYVWRPCDLAYLAWLGRRPALVRREVVDGRFAYALIHGNSAMGALELFVFALEHEMTSSDYRTVCQAVEMGEGEERDLASQLRVEGGGSVPASSPDGWSEGRGATSVASAAGEAGVAPGTAPSAVLGAARQGEAAEPGPASVGVPGGVVPESPEAGGYGFARGVGLMGEGRELEEGDREMVALMVRLMVAAHLCDAYVDPFQSDESTGYFSFASYLSWLWFDFSRCLGSLRLGYCDWCGQPYSLAGHRGKPRRYCSDRCKLEARNARAKQQRDAVRQGFLEGKGMDELTGLLKNVDSKVARQRVLDWLCTWPELKHMLDEAFDEEGVKAKLFRHCEAEGLGERVYSSALRVRLRKLGRG